MAKEPVFLYLGTFASREDAEVAYDKIKELHGAGVIGTYDAAVVFKDQEGTVHVSKDEKPTQYGAWTGLAVGAVVGLIFPPLMLADVAMALFGAGAGALIAHLRSGMSRSDAKEFGELIEGSGAALVVIGKSPLTEAVDLDQIKAIHQVEKQMPVEQDAFDAAMAEALQNLASQG